MMPSKYLIYSHETVFLFTDLGSIGKSDANIPETSVASIPTRPQLSSLAEKSLNLSYKPNRMTKQTSLPGHIGDEPTVPSVPVLFTKPQLPAERDHQMLPAKPVLQSTLKRPHNPPSGTSDSPQAKRRSSELPTAGSTSSKLCLKPPHLQSQRVTRRSAGKLAPQVPYVVEESQQKQEESHTESHTSELN